MKELYSDDIYTFPYSEVSHLIEDKRKDYVGNATVIFHHSKWNDTTQCFEPNIYMSLKQVTSFADCWNTWLTMKSLQPKR